MTTTQNLTTVTSTVRWLGLTTALLSLVTGGTFFAFSTFVMPALRRLGASDAVAAMQAINVQAPRSLLMLPLIGGAAGGVALAVVVLMRAETPNRALFLGGAACAVATLAITIVYHVPHNDALGRLRPDAPSAARAWADYYTGWVWFNHARTATALASGVAIAAGLLRRS